MQTVRLFVNGRIYLIIKLMINYEILWKINTLSACLWI